MNCLRCGREANASFCDECLKTVNIPLKESPYLNTQINLNAKKAHRLAHAATQASAKAEKKQVSAKGWIIAVVLLSILCAALACLCLWFGRKEIFKWLD